MTVGRGRGTEQLTTLTHPVDERAKEDASPTSPQEHSTPSDSEGTATGSMQLEKGRVKPVLDLSLQGLLSSLAARNNKLAAEVMKHTKVCPVRMSKGCRHSCYQHTLEVRWRVARSDAHRLARPRV